MEEYVYRENTKTKDHTNYPVNVYCTVLIEKNVLLDSGSCSMVRYLCAKLGYDGYGYASQLLHYDFSDGHIRNNPCYVVTGLSPFYCKTLPVFPDVDILHPSLIEKLQRRDCINSSFYHENKVLHQLIMH